MNSRGPFQPQPLSESCIFMKQEKSGWGSTLSSGREQAAVFAPEVTGSWVPLCSLLSLGNKELSSALKSMMTALDCWPASWINESRTSLLPAPFSKGGPLYGRPRSRPKLALASCAPQEWKHHPRFFRKLCTQNTEQKPNINPTKPLAEIL